MEQLFANPFAPDDDIWLDNDRQMAAFWQSVYSAAAAVEGAQHEVSVLHLEAEWLGQKARDALAVHNELWQEEQLARRMASEAKAGKAKNSTWQDEVDHLRSWAHAASELRSSDAVDWRFLWSDHCHHEALERLSSAQNKLNSLNTILSLCLEEALEFQRQ